MAGTIPNILSHLILTVILCAWYEPHFIGEEMESESLSNWLKVNRL